MTRHTDRLNPLEASLFDASLPFRERFCSVFLHQMRTNPVYRRFVEPFGYHAAKLPDTPDLAPLLPVEAFRRVRICSTEMDPVLLFRSSGTGTMERSLHAICNPELYRTAILEGFRACYPGRPVLLAWMPGYLDNPDSSLIWMVHTLLEELGTDPGGFLQPEGLQRQLDEAAALAGGRPVILFGAAFGLLDLIDMDSYRLPVNSTIIETGGMKTYRREITKDELHVRLATGFGLSSERVHSEYGMCELLSQAWSGSDGWFRTPHWMRVTVRLPNDPSRICEPGEEGLIGIVDLANLHSCPFLLTGDRGVADSEGRFQVLGRYRPDDLRGCNFLLESV